MLNFKEWRKWVRSKPSIHKWFIFIVLFRPIIDAFYKLKTISAFLSPLYLAAVLTAILSIIAFIGGPKRIGNTFADKTMRIWTVVAIVNMFFIAVAQIDIFIVIELILRFTLPFFLYFFIRQFIRNRTDLIRLFQTYLYSQIFVLFVFFYELTQGPIRVEISRGFARYVGVFADNYNYSFFIILVFFIVSYLYFCRDELHLKKYILWIILAIDMVFLSRVVHIATWGIFAFLIIWFLYSTSKIHKPTFILLLILGAIGYYYLGNAIKEDYIIPATVSEMAAIRGEAPIERLGHGRMTRWVEMVPTWKSTSFSAKIIGMPTELNKKYFVMFTGFVHNDFLRILFLFGLIGFTSFIIVLIFFIRKSLRLPPSERYLLFGAVIILSLYSISGNGMLYSQLLYIVFSIFSYYLLPLKLILPSDTLVYRK